MIPKRNLCIIFQELCIGPYTHLFYLVNLLFMALII